MVPAARLLSGLLAVAALTAGAAEAANFGHARLASAAGEPLLILVPVSDLTAADLQALAARPAPASDWAQAGLTPPVALDSLSVTVTPDVQGGARRVLRIASGQAFSGTLADLLLDVHTATGEQRYQVSLVAPGPVRVESPASSSGTSARTGGASAVGAAAAPTSVRRMPAGAIAVRSGDTMFGIARRHAVDGVSIYQLMMALQRANPQAFIHENINLVRAGASLAVPSVDDMLSISDAEARRQFQAQTAAFARLRGRQAAAAPGVTDKAAGGAVSAASAAAPATADAGTGDRVQLSQGGKADDAADTRAAQGHALKDAESRVGQLQDNVQHLNEALQSQGQAARAAASHGAQAIGQSIQQIASAISEASHEAAAQADAPSAASGAAAEGSAAGAAQAPGRTSVSAGTAASGAAGSQAGTAQSGGAASGGAATTGSSTAAAAVGGTAKTAQGATGSTPADLSSALAPKAPSAAETSELKPSEQAEHRVSWIQDHLLWVMTALLAVIVFIIAWLLRRANATRDGGDGNPQITEAMVREKLQGVDLDLQSQDATQPPKA